MKNVQTCSVFTNKQQQSNNCSVLTAHGHESHFHILCAIFSLLEFNFDCVNRNREFSMTSMLEFHNLCRNFNTNLPPHTPCFSKFVAIKQISFTWLDPAPKWSNCDACVWLCDGMVKSRKSKSVPCVSAPPISSCSSVSRNVSVCELVPYASTLILVQRWFFFSVILWQLICFWEYTFDSTRTLRRRTITLYVNQK